MANMTFGSNILPKDNTVSLGNSNSKWNVSIGKIHDSIYTGTGTAGQAGSSSKAYIPSLWTFDLGMTPSEYDIITINVPVAGVSSGVWLSVDNGVHYYPIAVNNKTRLTTQYAINNQITLIYQTNMVTTTYGTDQTGAPKGSSAADLTSDRWVVLNYYDANTTYTNVALGQGYGTCTTAAATAAKEVTLASYALTVNGIVAVKFTYDVPANATLNINAKGAKAIYYKGAKITAGVIKAGDLAYFMYNSYYYLLGIDRISELSSLNAASGGTNVSLVTTGEKYTWNNMRQLPAVTSNDNGKILRVVSGAWVAGAETKELPTVTSTDNGKFLRVVDGAWAAATVSSANGVSF